MTIYCSFDDKACIYCVFNVRGFKFPFTAYTKQAIDLCLDVVKGCNPDRKTRLECVFHVGTKSAFDLDMHILCF